MFCSGLAGVWRFWSIGVLEYLFGPDGGGGGAAAAAAAVWRRRDAHQSDSAHFIRCGGEE
jgi:hypothetical protein